MAVETHARQQVREAVAKALQNLPTTGTRVFTGRPDPLTPQEMPGLVVTTPNEQISDDFSSFSGGAVKYGRSMAILVTAYDAGRPIDDRLDRMALEIEQALGADPTLGGILKTLDLVRTDVSVDEATKRIGQLTLAFEAIYRTARGAPQTIIG